MDYSKLFTDREMTPLEQSKARAKNNPQNKPIGHYTGRCGRCGSNDLWDDNSAYGCNTCKAIFFTGEPRII